jgi:hypothetical protein
VESQISEMEINRMSRNLSSLFLALLAIATLSFTPASGQTTTTKPLGVTVRRATTLATTAATTTASATTSQYTTYDFNWSYTPNLPVCLSTNIACYDGFVLTNTTLGTVIGTQSQIGPSLLSYSYTPASGIPYGTTAFSLVAHGYDETGAPLSSIPPATVSATVKVTSLNGPTNLQVKPQ